MNHVYVHVPFCVRRCSYCDFSIAVRRRIPVAKYVECILTEFESAFPRSRRACPERSEGERGTGGEDQPTLYFGGGTPSLLPPDAIASLVRGISAELGKDSASEITLEANPEDVTPANAAAWREAGINRISLGAQSFDDRVLQWMHRSHDARRIGEAVGVLQEAGFENISLDLIFALPEELKRDWKRDLEAALSLFPAHLSLYGLTVEPRTPLARWVSRGATITPSADRYADEYLLAHELLGQAGFTFYEVSNAARPGFHSRHNAAYWSGRPYMGLGPAAHSFTGQTRRWNLSAWEAYRLAIAEGRSPVESEETLTNEQRETESVYLALRTSTGLPLTATASTAVTAFLSHAWMTVRNGHAVCTPEGWLRLDALVADLTQRAVGP
jgi:oxygen-independent coproporphyrinogen-3 oxidase